MDPAASRPGRLHSPATCFQISQTNTGTLRTLNKIVGLADLSIVDAPGLFRAMLLNDHPRKPRLEFVDIHYFGTAGLPLDYSQDERSHNGTVRYLTFVS